MDHSQVNQAFVADFLAPDRAFGSVLDVGTGTAQIPIALCKQIPRIHVLGIDLADHMLARGKQNVHAAGLDKRIELRRLDAKKLPLKDGSFQAVLSNSIIHHIPEPRLVLAEMIRVTAPGGALFVRDLLRQRSNEDVQKLVRLHAGTANDHQRQMFEDSLRAALSLEEIRLLIGQLGFNTEQVIQTSDRHWTWAAIKA